MSVEGANREEVLSLMRDLREDGFLPAERPANSGPAMPSAPQVDRESPEATEDGALFGSDERAGPGAQAQPGSSDPCELAVNRRPDGLAVKARLPQGSPAQEISACALVLLGAEAARGQSSITAASLTKWVRLTGFQVERIDTALQPLIDAGFILPQGRRRGKRYLLSETGRQEARRYASELLAKLGLPGGTSA